MIRIGLLTSGGDCQALNATMRAFVKTVYEQIQDDIEIIGFLDGYKGLMYEKYKIMTLSDFQDILLLGGSILGSSRCPFKKMRVIEDGFDKVDAMKKTYHKLKLDCLVVLGGNGSLKTAHLLSSEGLNVIGLPKTIDNDTWGTDYTFGYQSAIDIASNYLDQIHTTASSHHRIFIVEVMGHKVGHICLSAGIASGADIILLPEIPYDIDKIVEAINKKKAQGQNDIMIACAEGAISKEEVLLSKKMYKLKVKAREGHSVVYEIADKLQPFVDNDIRVSCIGHAQRGGQPCPYDRLMATRFGVEAASLLIKKDFGRLVVLEGIKVSSIPLEETAGLLKKVDIEGDIVQHARLLGISFGDE